MATTSNHLIGIAILAAAFVAASPVHAAPRDDDRSENRRGAKAEPLFPAATREEPSIRPSQRLQRPLGQAIDALNEGESAKARELAEGVLNNERANAYDKSVAAQVAGNAAMELDDAAAAIELMQRALEEGALSNDAHYSVMQNLAIAQLNDDQNDAAIATLKQLIDETKTQNPDLLYSLAGAHFQAEQFPQAIEWLKQAIALAPAPNADWLKLLQGAYLETDQPAEAIKIGEQLLTTAPDDKRLLFSMASAYLDLEQQDKALALIEDARSRGLFTEARDYQTLYSLYFNADGREKDVIAVIDEGLSKGILQRDLPTLGALAQAAYFSEDMERAIAVYKEAATLDPKGETGLNYAKVLSAEALDEQALGAAKAALAKGVAKPGEAWMVIARAESQLGNDGATRSALQEAAKFAETREQANRMLQQNR